MYFFFLGCPTVVFFLFQLFATILCFVYFFMPVEKSYFFHKRQHCFMRSSFKEIFIPSCGCKWLKIVERTTGFQEAVGRGVYEGQAKEDG